ncbi:MAG: hypothetical protein VYC39_15600 [Myxococcota bacterium]|nr:hypothetical protein [Myxococcota bacterium]
MLGGYNHNIRYRDRVYHVQTEDLGLQAARIRTHIFFNGAVVAETQQTYAELLHQPMPPQQRETYIRGRMQALHKDAMKKLTEGKLDALIFRLPQPSHMSPTQQHDRPPPNPAKNPIPPRGMQRPTAAPSNVPGHSHIQNAARSVGPQNHPAQSHPQNSARPQQYQAGSNIPTEGPLETTPSQQSPSSVSSIPPVSVKAEKKLEPPEDIPGRAKRLFPKKDKKTESMSAEERMIQARISRSESSIVKNRKSQISDEVKEADDRERSARASRSRNTVRPYKVD